MGDLMDSFSMFPRGRAGARTSGETPLSVWALLTDYRARNV